MTKVALLRCESYNEPLLEDILLKSLALTDIPLDIFNGKKVGIKPNLLMPTVPDQAVVTHPLFFKAVAGLIMDNGGTPVLIESPAFHPLKKTMAKTGYADIISELGITVASTDETSILRFAGGKTYRRFEILKGFFDVDVIVNLPKLKSHGFTYISAGVKNLFGAIPGLKKSQMHMKAQSYEDFSEYLLDLYGAFLYGFSPKTPMITIMDAVLALEGEGPGTSGTPRAMNAVITSRDALAADYAAALIASMDLEKARTVSRGFEREYLTKSPKDIKILGDSVSDLKQADFKVIEGKPGLRIAVWPLTAPAFKNLMVEKPVPSQEICTLCYHCKTICPAKAISKSKNGKTPDYDYNTCIRCFCCMEICPEAAIRVQKGKLQWLLSFR